MAQKKFKFSQDQEKAIEAMAAGHNVFLTGEAGTGKSTGIEGFKERVKGRKVAVVAPTGVAALNVGGQTIHSLFKFGFGIPTAEGLKKADGDKKLKMLLQKIDTIIIDEISMVRADIFYAIDYRLRQFCDPSKPFGGKQIICVGDFFQLPPVVKNEFVEGSSMREGEFLTQRFGGTYSFQTEAWLHAGFSNEKLTIIHRQGKDKAFTDLLNNIRHGIYDEQQLSQISMSADAKATVLAPTRAAVDAINTRAVKELRGKAITYRAEVSGEFVSKDGKKVSDTDDPAPRELVVKKGLRVILLTNDKDQGFVNGDVGTVSDMSSLIVEVELDRGKTVRVEQKEWDKTRMVYDPKHDTVEEEVIGTFKQMPMRPAYAITIHKSQGMTLDKVHIDLGNGCFAHGQLYVALSRCRALSGLSVSRPISKDDIICDERVEAFYRNLDQEQPNTEGVISMDVPESISEAIANLIYRYRAFGERPEGQRFAETPGVVGKREKKADIESEIACYSQETQNALRSFTPAEKEFYCMLQRNGEGMQAKDMAEDKQVSQDWARRTLAKLAKAGLVVREGSKKTGSYKPTKNENGFSFAGRCQKCPLFLSAPEPEKAPKHSSESNQPPLF